MALLRMKTYPSKVLILLVFAAVTCYAKVEGSAENNALSSPSEKSSNNSAGAGAGAAAAAAIAEKSPYVPSLQTAIWPGNIYRGGDAEGCVVVFPFLSAYIFISVYVSF